MTNLFNVIQIETQHGCNYKCVCCPNKYVMPFFDKMSESLFKKIIDELGTMDFSGRISPYFFNEPTLDLRLPEFIKYIKKTVPRAIVKFNTNASVLRGKVAQDIVDAGLDAIEVSVYTVRPEEYQILHGTKVPFEEVKENIINFRKIFKGSISVYVVGGLGTSSRQDMEDALGIPVGVAPRINRGGNIEGGTPLKRDSCKEPYLQMYIDHTGKAVACCMDFYSTVVLGDCNNQTLKDIWYGDAYNNIRNIFKENPENIPDICKKCDYHS